ncbi:MAG: N-acetylgalactosamine-4-sulfatase, partial [Verrucomicrobiales bacterium]|nr:N-acetylgalactosamine-4-sulfatase [Verrucomicrobiales bacterium]
MHSFCPLRISIMTLLCFAMLVDGADVVKPNVILVVVDDQGYGDLSCHGNPVLKTPHLDKFHNESIRLTDFHVAPMCTPTRGQLLTGVDALRNGAMNVSSGRTLLRREFPTMAEIFSSNGYRTAIFGKWHLGDNYPYRPQDRGFEESIWFPSSHIPSAAGYWNDDYFDDTYSHNGMRQQFKGYCTDVFFEEARHWMRESVDRKEQFFCYLPLNAAHGPLFVPDQYRALYRDQKPAIASFFGMIANIDENMGKLDLFLRDAGLWDNTILIFMTDNGTATGDPVYNAGMRGKKISLYEGGHRVPFFIRWPQGQLRNPDNIDALTECQDVLPTLMDLCGLKRTKRATFDGVSLAKLLRGKKESIPDRMLVSQFSRMDRPVPSDGDGVVLWNKWRLVTGTELYDISKDPGQDHNVIKDFPGIAEKMRKHYKGWWAGVAPRVNEFEAIHIGSDHENPTMLTPCDWRDVFLDQQAQVRRDQKNGVWTLFVERAGDYELELRRWPIEADLAITAAAPEFKGVDGVYRRGEAFPVTEARIQCGKIDERKAVAANEKAISFNASLKAGRMDLQTWFYNADGKELCGAYYVYVQRKAK